MQGTMQSSLFLPWCWGTDILHCLLHFSSRYVYQATYFVVLEIRKSDIGFDLENIGGKRHLLTFSVR